MIALISHASKVMLKILQARLQQYMNCELPDVQVVLEKAEEPEINLPTSTASSKKQESSRKTNKQTNKKTSISALLTMPKSLTVWITINCGKLLKSWEYQTTWPASWESCMHLRKQQLELDTEQQIHCLTYTQSIMRNAGVDETQAGIKIARRNINNLRYADDTTIMAESEEELSLLMKVKEES